MDKRSNHIRNVLHGFFLSIGTTIAEPSTILPLILNAFGGGALLVGFFSAFLRGGAIIVQMFAAFQSQNYARMLPYLRRVFFIRFLAWFGIGVSILLFGTSHPNITLLCIGTGLFIFSFSAGFGAIYFKDILAKIFTHKFRGRSMAYRQFFTALGGLVSGSLAAVILDLFQPPLSYGYLFMISAFFMGFGYLAFATVDEPEKIEMAPRENSFKKFLYSALETLKADKDLQIQVTTFLLAYGYLMALPFIILDAKSKIELSASAIGILITTQMVGAMLSNFLWGKLTGSGKNRHTAGIAIGMHLIAVLTAFFATTLYEYMLIFFLIGAAADGNRIASGNLILILAPPQKRSIYVALQINIVSFGMFFSILGGLIVHISSYKILYGITAAVLTAAFLTSLRLKDEREKQHESDTIVT
ncbi:MFS transporter [Sulfurimonas sp. HSL-1716]|uniref:MFS transporter n=1 Tax=Hydrocurvibacter sulfurireducens TaxID=3131937 RepID=UPI0031F96611